MKHNTTEYTVNGNIFLSLLTILFIALKLLGKINWKWIWVLSPIWISLIIACTVIIGFIWWDYFKGSKK